MFVYSGGMFAGVIEAKVELPDSGVDDELRRLELQRRECDAELIATICVAEARNLFCLDGHRSMNAYLRATFNWSRAEATRWLNLARAVDHVPGIGDALVAGRIGVPQVAEFAKAHSNVRVRDALDALAPTLVRHAEELSFPDFQIVLQHAMALADEDGAVRDESDSVKGRRATAVNVDGELFVQATGGDALTTAEVLAILDRFVDREFRRDVEAVDTENQGDGLDLPRTDTQRRHDAIVEIFRTANAALDDGISPSATEPTVNIVIDDATFARMLSTSNLAPDTDLDGVRIDPFTGLADPTELLDGLLADPDGILDLRCETANGVVVSARHVLQAALAGHVRRVVVDAAGTVIDLGRRSRLFTGSARQAALVLLRRCQHPGCEIQAEHCQVDHSVEHHQGGATDQANAGGLCAAHNREKHRRRWRVRRAANGHNYTIRDDGTVMLPVGCRPPTFPTTDDAAHISSGERVLLDRLEPWSDRHESRSDRMSRLVAAGWPVHLFHIDHLPAC